MALESHKTNPALNMERAFSDNIQNALSLMYLAKMGQKGNHKKERYGLPAFNVTTVSSINAAFTAFEMLGSSGLLAFSNSALKHFGRGGVCFVRF